MMEREIISQKPWYTPQDIAIECRVSFWSVTRYLRAQYPKHEYRVWWRFNEEEYTALCETLKRAKCGCPAQPLHWLRLEKAARARGETLVPQFSWEDVAHIKHGKSISMEGPRYTIFMVAKNVNVSHLAAARYLRLLMPDLNKKARQRGDKKRVMLYYDEFVEVCQAIRREAAQTMVTPQQF